MTETPEERDPQLEPWLESLHAAPPRDPARAAQARAAFLAAANSAGAVSAAPRSRLNHWKNTIRGFFRPQQERKPMFSTFGTILLIAALLLGGGGATAVAAQTAEPDGALYPVKVWSEEVRFDLARTDQNRLELALQFADRRMTEIQNQLAAGEAPDAALQLRLQNQLELALRLAAGMPPEEAPGALLRVQAAFQNQLRAAEAWQTTDPAGEQLRQQVRAMLQERLNLCAEGLQDPLLLRQRMQERLQNRINVDPTLPAEGSLNPWTEGTPTPGSGYGPGPGDNQNPWTEGTPTPGSGYGPGPGDGTPICENCTPGVGPGPGDGDGTPECTPGTGPGPGDGTPVCETCTPGTGTGPGPQATGTASGGSGGSGGSNGGQP
ncbi:MAG: hypothetical protein GYA20_00480 [Chloroflexi bacterium]|nr:hypothetical protein [Chloroflexota bacterium]